MSFSFFRNNNRRAYNNAVTRGFTVLELLIVLFIIVILMSLVLASFDRSRKQINSDKLISDMRLLRLC